MSVVKSYRDLLVWQRAMELVVESYKIASLLPKSEAYGLVSQFSELRFQSPRISPRGMGDSTWAIICVICRSQTDRLWSWKLISNS
jgi:hypothetical protein